MEGIPLCEPIKNSCSLIGCYMYSLVTKVAIMLKIVIQNAECLLDIA